MQIVRVAIWLPVQESYGLEHNWLGARKTAAISSRRRFIPQIAPLMFIITEDV